VSRNQFGKGTKSKIKPNKNNDDVIQLDNQSRPTFTINQH